MEERKLIKRILFINVNNDERIKNVVYLEKLLGKKNVLDLFDLDIPEALIRCTKDEWEDVKFKLDLDKVYRC